MKRTEKRISPEQQRLADDLKWLYENEPEDLISSEAGRAVDQCVDADASIAEYERITSSPAMKLHRAMQDPEMTERIIRLDKYSDKGQMFLDMADMLLPRPEQIIMDSGVRMHKYPNAGGINRLTRDVIDNAKKNGLWEKLPVKE